MNPNDPTGSRLQRRWSSAGEWLLAPLEPATTAAGRRRRMLAWLLVSLLLLTVAGVLVVLLVDPAGSARRHEYIPFILLLDGLVALAYLINAAGYYRWAASITVIAAMLGPWGSALFDPSVLGGDFVPLAYTTVSVLLSSILLSPAATALLAILQLGGLAIVALVTHTGLIDWPSFLTLVLVFSVISILSGVIGRDDLRQIDIQTRELEVSEAEMRELSVRDHLTGLFNRRYLEETLEREIRRSERAGRTIGVILLDVDGFKAVNDRWGHEAGDLLLQELGQLFKANIRGGDIACRYGGDEFVMVLPEASLEATEQRAEAIRGAVKEIKPQHRRHLLGMITISAGVALYPLQGLHAGVLLRSADNAMYRAKEAGRDCVVEAEPDEP